MIQQNIMMCLKQKNKKLSFGITQLEYVVEKIIEITSQKTSNGTNKYDVPEKNIS